MWLLQTTGNSPRLHASMDRLPILKSSLSISYLVLISVSCLGWTIWHKVSFLSSLYFLTSVLVLTAENHASPYILPMKSTSQSSISKGFPYASCLGLPNSSTHSMAPCFTWTFLQVGLHCMPTTRKSTSSSPAKFVSIVTISPISGTKFWEWMVLGNVCLRLPQWFWMFGCIFKVLTQTTSCLRTLSLFSSWHGNNTWQLAVS